MEKIIRFGIIGPGHIVPRFVKGASKAEGVEIYAIGSRSLERAQHFAEVYRAEKAFLNEDLLNCPEVDAVYVATPNQHHYEWIRKALEHHKHVISEKPMVYTQKEVKELYEIAYKNNVILMEACKNNFLPLTARIKEVIKEGKIGEVYYLDGKFARNHGTIPEDHWLVDRKQGGAMGDVGVYPLSYFNYLADAKIAEVKTLCRYKGNLESSSLIAIRYENGILANCLGSVDCDSDNKSTIYGQKGKIEVANFWKSGKAEIIYYDGSRETIETEMVDDFTYEIAHFADCIRKGLKESPIMNEAASLEITRAYESRFTEEE